MLYGHSDMKWHTQFRCSWVCDWITACKHLDLLCFMYNEEKDGDSLACLVPSHHLSLRNLAPHPWSFHIWRRLRVPEHSFMVQALGPVPHVRAGARSLCDHPQHHVFGCSPMLPTKQAKHPVPQTGAIGWLVQLFPAFVNPTILCPVLPPLPHLLSDPCVPLPFHLAFRKEKEVPTLPQHSCRVLAHDCVQSGKDGMEPYHRLPCAHAEVVHSYLGWLLNNLLSASIHNFFSHVTLYVWVMFIAGVGYKLSPLLRRQSR